MWENLCWWDLWEKSVYLTQTLTTFPSIDLSANHISNSAENFSKQARIKLVVGKAEKKETPAIPETPETPETPGTPPETPADKEEPTI